MMRSLLPILALSGLAATFVACGNETPEPLTEIPDGGDGTSDAGFEPDAGEPDAGNPNVIEAPAETWTWVDFPDAVCGNGEPTGIGVNLTDASNDLIVYMQGGGACWNAPTCFGIPNILQPTADNLSTGYGSESFDKDTTKNLFAFDRSQAANPFRDMSYVFIPYCTGDVHAGNAVQSYDATKHDVHHKGGANIDAFLERLVPTFPNVQRVFISGTSAGAFGAQLNYERFRAAFPNAELHVLADSGQIIKPSGTRFTDWQTAWGLTINEACTNCTTNFTLFPAYLASTYPDSRFALTAYNRDATLAAFFGYSGPDYQAHTEIMLENVYDPAPNAQYFLLDGDNHTMLRNLHLLAAPDGTTLLDWVTGFVDGAETWDSVSPPAQP